MRRIDRTAQERFGIPELVLMEHAGTEVARVALRWLKRFKDRRGKVLVLSGGGANGGDGFVAARHLDNQGVPVQLILIADPRKIAGAAQINLQILRRLKLPVTVIRSRPVWNRWAAGRHTVSLGIDALLGTGFQGQVREPIVSAIQWLNRQRWPILSVDIPSGLSADTGRPNPVAVLAKATVTCGWPKVGLYRAHGPRYSGKVLVADISLPRRLRPWSS